MLELHLGDVANKPTVSHSFRRRQCRLNSGDLPVRPERRSNEPHSNTTRTFAQPPSAEQSLLRGAAPRGRRSYPSGAGSRGQACGDAMIAKRGHAVNFVLPPLSNGSLLQTDLQRVRVFAKDNSRVKLTVGAALFAGIQTGGS